MLTDFVAPLRRPDPRACAFGDGSRRGAPFFQPRPCGSLPALADPLVNAATSPQPAPPSTWLSYASPLLLRRLAGGAAVEVPDVEDIEGAVVLLDVEGFSAFAERMGSRGVDGVERLAQRINETFAAVVEAIERYGGVAHSFPGDSVIALWPCDDRTLEDAVLLASRCSLELLEAHRESELPLKAGLSAGPLRLAHVGGIDGRRQLLLSGNALDEMGRAEERSSRGRLIAAAAASRLLAPHAVVAADADGFADVKSLRSAPPPARAPKRPVGDTAVPTSALRPYLPLALIRQLDAGHSAWLGEFRDVTVLFLQLRPGADAGDPTGPVQAAFAESQRLVLRHGGDIARFAHDDKGLAVLAVFGLPPASSEDAAARAVEAALEIEAAGRRHGFGCRIGVASGRVFCGTLGAPDRREYSVVGSTANLAARLMQSLESGVLCDRVTADAAARTCRFAQAGRLRPKGFPEGLEVFRAGDSLAASTTAGRVVPEAGIELVGREPEQRRLQAWWSGVRDGACAFALVSGEAGIGKTSLVRDVLHQARSADVDVFAVSCPATESSGTYAAFGRLLVALLRLEGGLDPSTRGARLLRALEQAGVPEHLAPLAAPLLGIDLDDNDATREMTGATRADNLLALLSRLLLDAAARARKAGRPLLLVFEDAHWLDPSSWELVALLGRREDDSPPAMLLTVRSEATPTWPDWQDALPASRTERLHLAPLGQAETAEYSRRLLHADSLTPQLALLLWDRTRGNPFFCEQLVSALAETAIVRVEAGVASLRVRDAGEAESLVPRSVAAVVTSRLDRLPAPVQLTLKTASVIGTPFPLRLLLAVHPMQPDEETLRAHLADASEMGLLEAPRADGEERRFRHAITCAVAYNLLLGSQRRQLHRQVAEHLERSDDAPAAQAALFYHWRRSGDEAQALRHVDQAGSQAMREGRYHAVVELYGYALEILGRCESVDLPETTDRGFSREALWSGHLGKARIALGLHEEARADLEFCLESLGERVPSGGFALATATAREALRQALHRLRGAGVIGLRRDDAARLKLAADSHEQLGYVYYSAGQTTHGLHAALRILNLSELAGLPDRMAASYAVMSLTAAVVGLRRLASLYDRRAMKLARRTDDSLVQSYVGWVTGLRAAGQANWSLASMRLEAARSAAEAAGDRHQTLHCLQALAWPAWARGDTVRMAELAEAQLAIARESNNRLWETWALNGQSEALAMLGDAEGAIRNCRRCLEVLAEESDRAEEIRALGLLAVSLLRRARGEEALATARRGLDLLRGVEMTNFSMFEGIAGIAEVLIDRTEELQARTGNAPSSARRRVRLAIGAMARFARPFAIGRPRLHVLRARLAALDGSVSLAVREFDRALRAADDFAMPHERGLALLAAASSRALDTEARRRHADEACGLLKGDEALRRAKQCRSELTGRPL
jgi:class 3 adenylate cyclase/tetratricopeptide (TPR) repeat protein